MSILTTLGNRHTPKFASFTSPLDLHYMGVSISPSCDDLNLELTLALNIENRESSPCGQVIFQHSFDLTVEPAFDITY